MLDLLLETNERLEKKSVIIEKRKKKRKKGLKNENELQILKYSSIRYNAYLPF